MYDQITNKNTHSDLEPLDNFSNSTHNTKFHTVSNNNSAGDDR